MIYGWESEEERLLRFIKIPPKKKLEWLRRMNEFSLRLSKENKFIRQKLKEEYH